MTAHSERHGSGLTRTELWEALLMFLMLATLALAMLLLMVS